MLRPLLIAVLLALAGRPAGAFTIVEATVPMTATIVRDDAKDCGADCPEWLALVGKIGFDTPAVLRAALARLGARKVPVLLDSPGGESTAALAMGRMIRARGLDTAVASTALADCAPEDVACAARRRAGVRPGHVGTNGAGVATCASACVFLLAAGAQRDVPTTASVGVHQAMRIVTTRPRTGYWRILSRIVGGRRIEVSRTLVITRVLPERVTKGAAPESLYAEFGRYLAGMGIAPSILPLMRATPPSGIHWMTPAEIAGTRIATAVSDAGPLVKRETEAQAVAAALRVVAAPAALTLDDGRRWTGTVHWRVDASAPAAPTLVGDWEVPGRRLGGRLTLAAEAAPGAEIAFRLDARLHPAAGPGALPILTVEAPRLCDLSLCKLPISGGTAFDTPSAAFSVQAAWRDDFLADLRIRDWLKFNVRTDEGWGELAVALSSPGGEAIPAWERVCCDFAPEGSHWVQPVKDLPETRPDLSPFVVPGLRAVAPVASEATAPPRSLPAQMVFDPPPARQNGLPSRGEGRVTWTPLLASAAVEGSPATVLLGDVDLPALGLKVSIDVRASPPGVLGRLTFSVHATADDGAAFGTPTAMSVLYGYDERGHVLLLPDLAQNLRRAGDYRARVDVPATGPVAGAIQFAFVGSARRRLTVAVPLDGVVAGLLQAASRWQPAGS